MKTPLKSCIIISLMAALSANAADAPAKPATATPVEKPAPAMENPRGLAIDKAGNLYVSDASVNLIYKITPAAKVSILAGKLEEAGTADGPALKAGFLAPCGVAADGAGNVYVADTDNATIRKISASGDVTTLAGKAGETGSADGKGDAARFNDPTSVATDAAGNVYVADNDNYTVRKITPDGVVSTLVGKAGETGNTNGTGSSARFSNPRGIAIDAAGNLYIADESNSEIRKITPAGEVTTVAGNLRHAGSNDGTGGAASFATPRGLTVDAAGNIYVADTGNYLIRKITPAGVVTTLAGKAGQSGSTDGAGEAARFASPRGMAVDAAGNVYVADSDNGLIRKITPAGVVTTLLK